MIVPFWYAPEINYPLHELRRKVIERMVEAKGLVRDTAKFREVVDRHLSKVRYMNSCKYDVEIPARELQMARQGIRPTMHTTPPKPKKKPQRSVRDKGVAVAMERRRAARGRTTSSSR